MSDNFTVTPKLKDKKEDNYIIMSLRMEKEIRAEFDKLAQQSNRSRNELMRR